MKAASDQPGGAGSVSPTNHVRSSALRSRSSAAVAHSGQSMHRSGLHASSQPAQSSRLTDRRATGPMRPNQPRRTSNSSPCRSQATGPNSAMPARLSTV